MEKHIITFRTDPIGGLDRAQRYLTAVTVSDVPFTDKQPVPEEIKKMTNQFVTFLNALFAAFYHFVSNPRHVRLLVTVAVLVLVLVALMAPSLITLADHMGGLP